MPRQVAFEFARKEKIHAVIVPLKNGTIYLRPEYKTHAFPVIV